MIRLTPVSYTHLDLKETQIAIKVVKDFFQKELTKQLNLTRVSAPLFVTPESGLNDNLNGVEPVSYTHLDVYKRQAYERTLEVGAAAQKEMSQQDYELYGTYIPFSMAICHTINHKSGMDHTTYAHTGAMVNIYALGAGAEKFRGVFDNTEIYHKLAELTGVQ